MLRQTSRVSPSHLVIEKAVFAYYFVWVCNLVARIEGGTSYVEDLLE